MTQTSSTVNFGPSTSLGPALPAAPAGDSIANPQSPISDGSSGSSSAVLPPSGVVFGAAALALAGLATAIALETARKRKEEEARVRAEMERANAEAEAREAAQRAALAQARSEAEFNLILGQIWDQATGGQGPSAAWLAGAATAAEAARRKAKDREDEPPPPLPAWKEAMLDPKLPPPPPPPPPPVDLAKWKQQDYAAGEAWERERAYQEYRKGEASSSGPAPRNPFLPVLEFVRDAGEWIKAAVRMEKVVDVATAATQVNTTEVGETIRILGPRAARDTLGLRQFVNWVRPENSGLVAQSATSRALGGLASPGTLAGITLALAGDTQMYLAGQYDRHEYAAALTVDVGVAIGTSLVAGAVAGAVTGAIAGAGVGTITLPIVGTTSGAVVGGVGGAVAGILTAVGVGLAIRETGVRPVLIGSVADLYRSWTGDSP